MAERLFSKGETRSWPPGAARLERRDGARRVLIMIINRVQALNYGCLHYVDVPLDRFHVFIGPNASGKSTLMDAIKFVSDVVRDGVEAACRVRAANFADLVWGRPDNPKEQRFEIALEFSLPEEIQAKMPKQRPFCIFRYEMAVAVNVETGKVGFVEEKGSLLLESTYQAKRLPLFPDPVAPPQSILQPSGKGRRTVFRMGEGRRSRFNDETVEATGSVNWNPGLTLSLDRSAMSILPDYDDKFPAATRVSGFLRDKVIGLALNSERMRRASPPGMGEELRPDGSNIPWVADALLKQDEAKAKSWFGHMESALKGLDSVRVIDRPDDRHKYLMLKYENGLEAPSWKASDGTLRFMALTMLANLPRATGLYMIEEPENGIHPGALEELFNSLSCVYDAQVLLATHSPEIVAVSDIQHLRIFGKTDNGEVDITPGTAHPYLRNWQSKIDLGTFFASGILA